MSDPLMSPSDPPIKPEGRAAMVAVAKGASASDVCVHNSCPAAFNDTASMACKLGIRLTFDDDGTAKRGEAPMCPPPGVTNGDVGGAPDVHPHKLSASSHRDSCSNGGARAPFGTADPPGMNAGASALILMPICAHTSQNEGG